MSPEDLYESLTLAPRTGRLRLVLPLGTLSIGITTLAIDDVSPNWLHGWLLQLLRRGVTGFFWSGAVHDSRFKPKEHASIHFPRRRHLRLRLVTTFALDVPEDWRSGVYALAALDARRSRRRGRERELRHALSSPGDEAR